MLLHFLCLPLLYPTPLFKYHAVPSVKQLAGCPGAFFTGLLLLSGFTFLSQHIFLSSTGHLLPISTQTNQVSGHTELLEELEGHQHYRGA